MKIAIPVRDESLKFFPNAGHTPNFAIFNMNGTGMFRSFTLETVKNNPRTDLDHSHPDEEHDCSHGHDDAEHIAQHNKMGEVLDDCKYIVVKKACKNTANSFTHKGLKIIKYNGVSQEADNILKEISSQFI